MRPSLGPVVEDPRGSPRGLPGAQKGTLGEGGHPWAEGRAPSGQVASPACSLPVPGAEPRAGVGGRRPASRPGPLLPTQLECAGLTRAWIPQGPGIPAVGRGHSSPALSTRRRGVWAVTPTDSGLEPGSPLPGRVPRLPGKARRPWGHVPASPLSPHSSPRLRLCAPLCGRRPASAPGAGSQGCRERRRVVVPAAHPSRATLLHPAERPARLPSAAPRPGPGVWPQALSLSTSAQSTVGARPAAAPSSPAPTASRA